MASPYTQPSLTGYNATPPPDDGSETTANEVKWATHINKIGDPLKTFAQAIDTNISSAFALLPFRTVTALTGTTSVTTSDRGKFFTCTNAFTLTLPAAADATDSFTIIVLNSGTGEILIDGNSTETINGFETLTLVPGGSVALICDGSNWFAAQMNNGYVGEMIESFESSRAGYLLMNGQTVGNAASGATDAAAKYQALFEFLWDNLADSEAAVSSGRGTTATADWNADKTITMPDLRGRIFVGKDNMGGSSANVVTDAAADTVGASSGQEEVTQTSNELVGHTHSGAAHTHDMKVADADTGAAVSVEIFNSNNTYNTTVNTGEDQTITTESASGGATGSTGSGNAQNIMNPFMTANVFIRF